MTASGSNIDGQSDLDVVFTMSLGFGGFWSPYSRANPNSSSDFTHEGGVRLARVSPQTYAMAYVRTSSINPGKIDAVVTSTGFMALDFTKSF